MPQPPRPDTLNLFKVTRLHRLPNLTTVVTENRKSNAPMVLGFQGKSQMEALHSQVMEAMLSQPATKIFLKTSEPHASEWILKAIGEIEIDRFRESRTVGKFPRNSENQSLDTLQSRRSIGGLSHIFACFKRREQRG